MFIENSPRAKWDRPGEQGAGRGRPAGRAGGGAKKADGKDVWQSVGFCTVQYRLYSTVALYSGYKSLITV